MLDIHVRTRRVLANARYQQLPSSERFYEHPVYTYIYIYILYIYIYYMSRCYTTRILSLLSSKPFAPSCTITVCPSLPLSHSLYFFLSVLINEDGRRKARCVSFRLINQTRSLARIESNQFPVRSTFVFPTIVGLRISSTLQSCHLFGKNFGIRP